MAEHPACLLGGTRVDLLTRAEVFKGLFHHLNSDDNRPLVVASANLDHIYQFGERGDYSDPSLQTNARWWVLLDGMPLVWAVRRLTGSKWPRLPGADLLPGALAVAENTGAAVGFLGGTDERNRALNTVLSRDYPKLRVSGYWTPTRAALTSPSGSQRIAEDVRRRGTDILVVGLGKPLQEGWIREWGEATGARVMLGFGASADFLAGTASRSPRFMQRWGLEWLYRFLREPRRLFRRYVVQGPVAVVRLLRHSGADTQSVADHDAQRGEPPSIGVVCVTYNSNHALPGLLESLKTHEPRALVVLVDNASPEGLPDSSGHALVTRDSNGGYGAACNEGAQHPSLRDVSFIAFLNPDVRLQGPTLTELALRMSEMPLVAVATAPNVDAEGRARAAAWGRPSTVRSLWFASGLKLDGIRRVVGRLLRWGPFLSGASMAVQEDQAVAGHVLGGTLMVRDTWFRKVGGFDEGFFMTWEDADLCKRARNDGRKVMILNASPFVHLGTESSSGVSDDQWWQWYLAGARRYSAKHLGPIRRWLLLGGLRFGSVARTLMSNRPGNKPRQFPESHLPHKSP